MPIATIFCFMNPTVAHLDKLLEICHEWSCQWKLEFNWKKSNCVAFENYTKNNKHIINRTYIVGVKNFIYLGIPIGDDKFKEEYIEEKFRKCEKSFYSLYGLGCKPNALNPRDISFIYKQFCQSLFKFGFENLFVSKSEIENMNKRQIVLIKQAIGISKYCLTKSLFTCLEIDSVNSTYLKHKIFFFY